MYKGSGQPMRIAVYKEGQLIHALIWKVRYLQDWTTNFATKLYGVNLTYMTYAPKIWTNLLFA